MNWESLIGEKIEAHRDTQRVCKIEDARERNARRAQLKWKHEHRAEENERKRNQTPERKAWERERSKRRREAAKAAKMKEVA